MDLTFLANAAAPEPLSQSRPVSDCRLLTAFRQSYLMRKTFCRTRARHSTVPRGLGYVPLILLPREQRMLSARMRVRLCSWMPIPVRSFFSTMQTNFCRPRA